MYLLYILSQEMELWGTRGRGSIYESEEFTVKFILMVHKNCS